MHHCGVHTQGESLQDVASEYLATDSFTWSLRSVQGRSSTPTTGPTCRRSARPRRSSRSFLTLSIALTLVSTAGARELWFHDAPPDRCSPRRIIFAAGLGGRASHGHVPWQLRNPEPPRSFHMATRPYDDAPPPNVGSDSDSP